MKLGDWYTEVRHPIPFVLYMFILFDNKKLDIDVLYKSTCMYIIKVHIIYTL